MNNNNNYNDLFIKDIINTYETYKDSETDKTITGEYNGKKFTLTIDRNEEKISLLRGIGLENIPTHIKYIINDTITYKPIHLSIEFLKSYYSGNTPDAMDETDQIIEALWENNVYASLCIKNVGSNCLRNIIKEYSIDNAICIKPQKNGNKIYSDKLLINTLTFKKNGTVKLVEPLENLFAGKFINYHKEYVYSGRRVSDTKKQKMYELRNNPPKYMRDYFPKVQDIKESSNEN